MPSRCSVAFSSSEETSEGRSDGAGRSSSSSGADWLCESLSCSTGSEGALKEWGREEGLEEGRIGEEGESNEEMGGDGSIDCVLDEIASGSRYMKVYKQMKMYNDPSLNPVLYADKK